MGPDVGKEGKGEREREEDRNSWPVERISHWRISLFCLSCRWRPFDAPLDAKSSSISTFPPAFASLLSDIASLPRCASCVKCFLWRSAVWKHNDGGGTISLSLSLSFLSWQLGFFEMSGSKKTFSMESWWRSFFKIFPLVISPNRTSRLRLFQGICKIK